VLLGLLAGAVPWLTAADLAALHGTVRKMAHVIEYAILALLWFRALTRARSLPLGLAAAGAFAICVGWAALDETHQYFVPGRTGRVEDVAIDAAGSLAALAVARPHWLGTARVLTGLLLWVAALGGVMVLAIDQLTGVPSGYLWATAPLAALALVARRWWRGRAGSAPPATPSGGDPACPGGRPRRD
jgi:VanZ family protein